MSKLFALNFDYNGVEVALLTVLISQVKRYHTRFDKCSCVTIMLCCSNVCCVDYQ